MIKRMFDFSLLLDWVLSERQEHEEGEWIIIRPDGPLGLNNDLLDALSSNTFALDGVNNILKVKRKSCSKNKCPISEQWKQYGRVTYVIGLCEGDDGQKNGGNGFSELHDDYCSSDWNLFFLGFKRLPR